MIEGSTQGGASATEDTSLDQLSEQFAAEVAFNTQAPKSLDEIDLESTPASTSDGEQLVIS